MPCTPPPPPDLASFFQLGWSISIFPNVVSSFYRLPFTSIVISNKNTLFPSLGFSKILYPSGSSPSHFSMSSYGYNSHTSLSTLPTWHNDCRVPCMSGGWTSAWMDTWIINKAISEHFDWRHRSRAATTGKEPSKLTHMPSYWANKKKASPSKSEAKCHGSQMQFHKLFQLGNPEALDYGFYWFSVLHINTLFGSLKMTFLFPASITSFPT